MPELWTSEDDRYSVGWVDPADDGGYAAMDGGELGDTTDGYPYTDTSTDVNPRSGVSGVIGAVTGTGAGFTAGDHTYVNHAQQIIGVEEHGTNPLYRTSRPLPGASVYTVPESQDETTAALNGLDISQPATPVRAVTPARYTAVQWALQPGGPAVRIAPEDDNRKLLRISNTDASAGLVWIGPSTQVSSLGLNAVSFPVGRIADYSHGSVVWAVLDPSVATVVKLNVEIEQHRST